MQIDDTNPESSKSSGLFVAVGHRGLRMISSDGIEWTHPQTGKEGETYRAVAFGNGHFAAVGSYGGANILASTVDGRIWETSTRDAKYVSYLRGLGFGQEMLLGLGGDPGSVGDSKPFVMTSADGKTWSDPVSIAGKNMLRRVCYGNDRFVAVGDRGRRATSKNAKEWTDTPDVKAIDTLIDVTFGNGVFVGVGLHGLRMSSEDGVNWTERLIGEEGEHINSVVWSGQRFVAVGQGATYFSPDGQKWERLPNKNAPQIAVFGQGFFVGVSWRGRIHRSTDAIEWNDVVKAEHHLESITFGGG